MKEVKIYYESLAARLNVYKVSIENNETNLAKEKVESLAFTRESVNNYTSLVQLFEQR